MRALSLVIVLLCVACAKKPAAKAPTSGTPPATERKDAEPPADSKKIAPTSTSKPGDPCSGGE